MLDAALKISVVLLPLLYLALAVCYGVVFFASGQRAKKMARPLLTITLLSHLAYLVMLTLRWHQFPFANVSQALSGVAFTVAVVYAFVEWRGRVQSTGFWMLSVACVFEVMSSLLRSPQPPDRELFHNPLFAAHTGLGLLGYTAFVVAAGYGFLFLKLYSEIKNRKFSIFFGKLPSLEVLERMMTGALLAGFVALTGAVAVGAVWADQVFKTHWIQDPKVLMTLATWAFYGGTLLLGRLRQWQGRHLAIASLAGFAAILFSMLGVNLFLTNVHVFR